MVFVLGIDEAGRGPVIGSLFVCGVMIDESMNDKLKAIGVKDSKLLAHKKRLALAEEIKKIAKKIKLIKVTPKEIDEALSSDSLNLNWLEAHKQVEIINELKPDKAIIDCPSPNIKAYAAYLRNLLQDKNVELIVEHKADKNFPSVSASSIVAKCAREEEVAEIEKMVGESIGSGYPSNPICQKFLKDNFEKYPEIFRKSWLPYKNHDHAKGQKSLNEFKVSDE